MAELVESWPDGTNLGLIAYGHRQAGDCADIETLLEPQPVDKQHFIDTVNEINPKGKTPIAASLEQAAEVLKYRDHNATVVLISDGLESCHGDPCAVAAGENIRVIWTGPNEPSDYIGIFEPDAHNRKEIHYFYTKNGNPFNLKTPETPGTYEIRYVLHSSRQDLVRHTIEVHE